MSEYNTWLVQWYRIHREPEVSPVLVKNSKNQTHIRPPPKPHPGGRSLEPTSRKKDFSEIDDEKILEGTITLEDLQTISFIDWLLILFCMAIKRLEEIMHLLLRLEKAFAEVEEHRYKIFASYQFLNTCYIFSHHRTDITFLIKMSIQIQIEIIQIVNVYFWRGI